MDNVTVEKAIYFILYTHLHVYLCKHRDQGISDDSDLLCTRTVSSSFEFFMSQIIIAARRKSDDSDETSSSFACLVSHRRRTTHGSLFMPLASRCTYSLKEPFRISAEQYIIYRTKF